jgi:3-methylcrotonyl-CoA carboxylase alpha subunit
MNTRLQVEHPVTEMVTGLDLVKLQILIASGEKLPFSQNDLVQTGHAIEVRLYAEDPDNGFLPSIGKIKKIGNTTLRHMRLDCGYKDGNEVSISFDPMLAKLISWGDDRKSAASKMVLALNEVVFLGEGLKTNRNYLQRILSSKPFLEGKTFTHFVKTYEKELLPPIITDEERALAIAAMLSVDFVLPTEKSEVLGVWNRLSGFRSI